MRFHLIDRIESWEVGKSLKASKFLALGEEYLADHFPKFPVMPGVLMLQAAIEAASWLWRITTDYHHPVIVLRELKSVKYGTFMQPGRQLDIFIDFVKQDGGIATFKGRGTEDEGRQTITTNFVLHGCPIPGNHESATLANAKLLGQLKAHWALLTGQLRST